MKTVRAFAGSLLLLGATAVPVAACTFISRAVAVQDALTAVHGGSVKKAVLHTKDSTWEVEIRKSKDLEVEVTLNACNGKVISIVPSK